MLVYFKFIIFSIKVMWNIRHFKDFVEFDGSKGKSHLLQIRELERKIKGAQKRGLEPKKEHIFLIMFYETMSERDPKLMQEEMITLFSQLWWWHFSLETERRQSIQQGE